MGACVIEPLIVPLCCKLGVIGPFGSQTTSHLADDDWPPFFRGPAK